jgi:alpha-tubulin suppressor-like RCC1 family protein
MDNVCVLTFGAVLTITACVGDSSSGYDAGLDATSEAGPDATIEGGDAPGTCDGGQMCGGQCVDTQTDPQNCGTCGAACTGSFACTKGVCGNAIADIAAGSYVSCALLHEGSVWCWGDNAAGELGHAGATDPSCGSTACNPTPTKVSGLAGVTQISAGHQYVCAVSQGAVYCWGLNNRGQIGAPVGGTSFTPVHVGSLTNVIQVAAGSFMACAVTSAGAVYCWGRDLGGTFGNGAGDEDVDHSSETPVPVINVTNATEVAVQESACARTSAGEVWCWGINSFGMLGHNPGGGSPTDVTCATAVGYGGAVCNSTPQKVGALSNVAHVFADGGAMCAIKNDQTVYCWGYNGLGNYGDGTAMSNNVVGSCDGNVHLATLPQTILGAGEDMHACSIASDGTVWCWGPDADGQLGTPPPNSSCGACVNPAPQQLQAPLEFASKKALKISGAGWRFEPTSGGSANTMVLLEDGSLWGWGDNRFGQLGHGPSDADGGFGDMACALGTCGPAPVKITGLP